MKKVLLTGCGGSIAIHFIAHILTNTDWHIIGTDSFRHKGWMDRLAQAVKDHPDWKERIKIFTHDLNAPFSEMTKKKIGHIDYIISMASLSDVEASIQDPVPFIQNNINLVLYLLEYARELWGLTPTNQTAPEGTAFIQISTDEVYGPIERKDSPRTREWDPIVPSNPYAASKAAQEAIATSYWRAYGIPLIITNTMNNIGETQQSSKYPVIIQRALMKGETVKIHGKEGKIGSRSYIHSRNFADAILFLLKKTVPYQHVPNTADRPDRYNIGGDEQLDNLELAQMIAELMGKELKYELVDSHTARPGHDPHYGLSSEKIHELGWFSPLPLRTWLKSVIDWQVFHKEWIE